MTQSPAASEGLAAPRNVTGVPRDAVQNVLSVDSGQAGGSEPCIAIEGLAEDTAGFAQPEAADEAVTSEVLSHYVGPVAEKVAGEILLDEASLDIEGQPYQTAQVVIEETLVSSSTDISNGGIAVARPQVPDGVSVVTVVTGRVSFSSDTQAPVRSHLKHLSALSPVQLEILSGCRRSSCPTCSVLRETETFVINDAKVTPGLSCLYLQIDSALYWYQLCLNMTEFF